MQQLLSAILLSVALLLSGTAVKDADPDAPAKTGSYFIRVLEAAMRYEEEETQEEAPAPVKNIATVAESTGLYSSYSKSTKVLAQLKPGDALFIWFEKEGEPEFVGVYVGDGFYVAARSTGKPVSKIDITTKYYTEHFVFGRRYY